MSGPLHVFGYGSLMYQPTAPDALVTNVPAALPGWRRAFNKRSVPRGCASEAALLPSPLGGWHDDARRHSLALGTQPDPDATLHGRLLTWHGPAAERVRAALDRREGVSRPPHASDGYVARMVEVHTDQGVLQVRAYLTNLGGPLHTGDLDLISTARVLAHATPRDPGERARGADYLAGALAAVRIVEVTDPVLEELARAVASLLPSGRFEAGVRRFGMG